MFVNVAVTLSSNRNRRDRRSERRIESTEKLLYSNDTWLTVGISRQWHNSYLFRGYFLWQIASFIWLLWLFVAHRVSKWYAQFDRNHKYFIWIGKIIELAIQFWQYRHKQTYIFEILAIPNHLIGLQMNEQRVQFSEFRCILGRWFSTSNWLISLSCNL